MKLFLIALFLGMFIGYAICDLLSDGSKIVYHIKRLKLYKSPGGEIHVTANPDVESPQKRPRTRKERMKERLRKRAAKLNNN